MWFDWRDSFRNWVRKQHFSLSSLLFAPPFSFHHLLSSQLYSDLRFSLLFAPGPSSTFLFSSLLSSPILTSSLSSSPIDSLFLLYFSLYFSPLISFILLSSSLHSSSLSSLFLLYSTLLFSPLISFILLSSSLHSSSLSSFLLLYFTLLYILCSQLVALEELQLFGNHLSGAIPASLGNLVELKLLSLGEYTGIFENYILYHMTKSDNSFIQCSTVEYCTTQLSAA